MTDSNSTIAMSKLYTIISITFQLLSISAPPLDMHTQITHCCTLQGTQGYKGTTGDDGSPGSAGPPGPGGSTGSDGRSGRAGGSGDVVRVKTSSIWMETLYLFLILTLFLLPPSLPSFILSLSLSLSLSPSLSLPLPPLHLSGHTRTTGMLLAVVPLVHPVTVPPPPPPPHPSRVHLVFAVHVLHWAMAIRESSMAQSLEQMTTHWVRMAPQSAQPHPAMTSLWSCPRWNQVSAFVAWVYGYNY